MSAQDAPSPPVALRPLGVADVLDNSVRLAWRNARRTFPLALPVAVLAALATALATPRRTGDAALPAVFGATTFSVSGSSLGLALAAALLGTVLSGVLTPIYVGALLGRRVDVVPALRSVGARGVGALVALGVIVDLGEGVGLLLLVAGGVWLWGVWAAAVPALVEERLGPLAALTRSFRLVRGSFWRVWGVRALSWVMRRTLELAVTLPVAVVAGAIAGTHPHVFLAIVALGRLVTRTVLAPIGAATDVLLYSDLRVRREGLDILLMTPALPPVPAGAPTW